MAKISIYVGGSIEAALACVAGEHGSNRSGRLNTVCERYLAMVADELTRLDLSHAEWCALLDANNGTGLFDGQHPQAGAASAALIWANVADTPELGRKWGVDQAHLVARLRALPRSTLIAIVEACGRFWSRAEMDTDEALAASGILLADAASN